jgi:hypothetical protein
MSAFLICKSLSINALLITIAPFFRYYGFSLCFVGKFWQVNLARFLHHSAVSNRPKIVVRRGSATAQRRSHSDHVRLGSAEPHIVAFRSERFF